MKLAANSFPRSVALFTALIAIAAIVGPAAGAARSKTSGLSAPSALAATGSTQTSISVKWTASSARLLGGYGLYRDGTSVGSTTNTSYTFAGLACGTRYTLAVDAYNTSGRRSSKVSITASTAACSDTQPPVVPSGLTTSAIAQTSVKLSWAATTDNVAVAGYNLYRNGANVGSTTTTTYTFDGLACGTTYMLSLTAFDAAGNESDNHYATTTETTNACTPPPADTQAPTTPGSLATSGSNGTSISVSWAPSTDNVGVTGYTVYREGSSVGATGGTSYTYSGLTCGTTYTLAVDAIDAAGNRSAKRSLSAATTACPVLDTQPPAVPSGMITAGILQTSVKLAWSATSDNVAVAGYNLYRNGVKAGTSTPTSYTFGGLACGTTYTLALTAFDAAGNESDARYATTTETTTACSAAADTQAPTAPGGLAATGNTGTSISVAWNASSDNVGVTGYGAYRNGSSVGTSTGAFYVYSGLTCGTSYTLAVDAVDAAGNRSGKSTVTAATAACATGDTQAPTTPGSLTVTGATTNTLSVSWTSSLDNVGVTGYGVYVNGGTVGSSTGSAYTFVGLTCGTAYPLAIDAYDAAGNRSAKAMITGSTAACPTADKQAPTAPGSLAVTGASASSVSVTWSPSSDNVGVTGYGAYANGSAAGSSTGGNYTFTGLGCGTSYSLAVDAYDAAGNRSAKSTVSGSTSACAATGASAFVATGGSDSGSCTQSAPCKTFGRAYKVAQPGQVVEVAGGTYPQQTIAADTTKTSASNVVFKPAAGATVVVECNMVGTVGNGSISGGSCIDVYASHLTFDGGASKAFRSQTYSVNGFSYQGRVDTERGSSDVSFLNMDVGAFALGGPSSRIANNDIGPSVDPLNVMIVEEANGAVIENNLIHDFVIQNGGHFECMYWQGPDNVILRNNEFRSCAVYGLHAKEGTHNNELVENNVFWNPRGLTTQADVQFTAVAYPCSSVNVRNNTFTDGLVDDCSPTTVSGNIFRKATSSGSGWKNNLTGVADSGFVNAGAGDFHLSATSSAIHAGDPGNFPAVDKEGKTRTSPPDAGAFAR
jgi:chitodextrinase